MAHRCRRRESFRREGFRRAAGECGGHRAGTRAETPATLARRCNRPASLAARAGPRPHPCGLRGRLHALECVPRGGCCGRRSAARCVAAAGRARGVVVNHVGRWARRRCGTVQHSAARRSAPFAARQLLHAACPDGGVHAAAADGELAAVGARRRDAVDAWRRHAVEQSSIPPVDTHAPFRHAVGAVQLGKPRPPTPSGAVTAIHRRDGTRLPWPPLGWCLDRLRFRGVV